MEADTAAEDAFMNTICQISSILGTGLSKECLVICRQLLSNGVNPKSLALIIKELKRLFSILLNVLNCLEDLKHDLMNAIVSSVDSSLLFPIDTDKSEYAIAATLSQDKRPVAFFSLNLTISERRQTAVENDAYTISAYLIGCKILACFSYVVTYRPGAENVVADALSRVCGATMLSDLSKLHQDLSPPGITRMCHFVHLAPAGTSIDLCFNNDERAKTSAGVNISDIVDPTKEIIQARQRACYHDTEIQSSDKLDESTNVTESQKETLDSSNLSVLGASSDTGNCNNCVAATTLKRTYFLQQLCCRCSFNAVRSKLYSTPPLDLIIRCNTNQPVGDEIKGTMYITCPRMAVNISGALHNPKSSLVKQ
ncbi:hypothetical protein GJ496_011074 [Pomphorhynchus laevis]|nr:hypothetical protein GJ496_011074 [Pomphorhynchus laevis]